MKIEKVFRILTAILMPITFVLAFFTMPIALMSLGNPSTLIALFIFISVIIYMVKSVAFFRKNISTNLPAKVNTRDWIRVNAFVAMFFILEILATTFVVFYKPKELLEVMQTMLNSFQDAKGTAEMPLTAADMLQALKNIMVFFALYGVLMGGHIFISFKLLKKYRHLLSL